MKNRQYLALFIAATLFWQCEPSVDEFEASAGTADFKSFVSVGDSYSAGYVDGALGYDGQIVSFPNMIANQLISSGFTTSFKQPLTEKGKSVGTTTIDLQGNKNGYFILDTLNGSIKPKPTVGNLEIFSTLIGDQKPFNNVGVPGAKAGHFLIPGFGTLNPFYGRFASNRALSTVISDAMLNNPTFFSLWVGGNDVLGYALAGGEADPVTGYADFATSINRLVDSLTLNGAKGVIGNVPNVSAIPYFTTVTYNALVLDDAKATALNTAYAGYNQLAASKGLPTMVFKSGPNAFVISDPDLTVMPASARIRQIKSSEKLLLSIPQDSIKLKGWGSQKPIAINYVLDDSELKIISDATAAYNNSIKATAEAKKLGLVDLNAFMGQIQKGKYIDGVLYNSVFVKGNVFSLDGIHTTPRGSAIVANEFISIINSKFGASIPKVVISDYRANVFP